MCACVCDDDGIWEESGVTHCVVADSEDLTSCPSFQIKACADEQLYLAMVRLCEVFVCVCISM